MAARTVAPGRLRRRLTVVFLLVAGTSAAILAVGCYLIVHQARFDDSLRQAAADARYHLIVARQFLPLDDERGASLLASFESSGRHVVLATGTDTTASNPSFDPEPGPELRAAVAAGQLAYERTAAPGTAGRPAAPLLIVGGRIPGSTAELYVLHVEEPIHRDLAQLRYALLAGWVGVALLAGGVGHTLARRILEPVGRASRAARAVAEGLLATRLPVTGRDEFGAWAVSFNEMAAALEAKITALSEAQARERRFTADVAHELRTPVTALVAEASLLGEGRDALPPDARRLTELMVTDTVRLRRLLEELLEISRLDSGREPVVAEPVDEAALLRSIIAARGWRERVEVCADPSRVAAESDPLWTDPRRLECVLANLIANALEHGVGPVRVSVRRTGAITTFRVTDQGPGIPAEHLPYLFDRFYKVDPSRSGRGSGLGLAIARENARLLTARLAVQSEVGTGTEFRLEVPAIGAAP